MSPKLLKKGNSPDPVRKAHREKKTITVKLGVRDDHGPSPEYEAYMLSDKWAEKRKIAIAAAGGRCQMCYSPFNLEVHHRTYKRFGNEKPEDLTVVCHECHQIFHTYRVLYQF